MIKLIATFAMLGSPDASYTVIADPIYDSMEVCQNEVHKYNDKLDNLNNEPYGDILGRLLKRTIDRVDYECVGE